MERQKHFASLSTHAWLKKIYARLTKEELKLCHDFLDTNCLLDKGSFEMAVNRMFLDKAKPKHFTIIQELLTCANSAL